MACFPCSLHRVVLGEGNKQPHGQLVGNLGDVEFFLVSVGTPGLRPSKHATPLVWIEQILRRGRRVERQDHLDLAVATVDLHVPLSTILGLSTTSSSPPPQKAHAPGNVTYSMCPSNVPAPVIHGCTSRSVSAPRSCDPRTAASYLLARMTATRVSV